MRINILHIVDSLTIGGVQKILLSIVKHTNHRKINHFIAYSIGGSLEPEFREYNVQLYKLQDQYLRFRDTHGAFVIYKIIKYIRSNKIDIVHTHSFVPYFFGTIAAKICGIPVINHVHTEEYRRQTYAERLLKGNVVSSHPFLNKFLMQFTYRTITTAQSTQEELSKLVHNMDKVKLIYNGINIPERYFSQIEIENIKRKYNLNATYYICTIGRLTMQKNQSLFLRAAPHILQEFPDVQFIIVGDGPLNTNLKMLVKELKLDNSVIFTGALLDIYPILAIADIFVLSSVWEQFPVTILEAMSMRKPVVAPRIAGIPEAVLDGESGILFEPNNIDQLANAILALLKNKKQATIMGMRGYQIIGERFINEKQVRKIEDIYLSFSK